MAATPEYGKGKEQSPERQQDVEKGWKVERTEKVKRDDDAGRARTLTRWPALQDLGCDRMRLMELDAMTTNVLSITIGDEVIEMPVAVVDEVWRPNAKLVDLGGWAAKTVGRCRRRTLGPRSKPRPDTA
jgi:hypothetical protein